MGNSNNSQLAKQSLQRILETLSITLIVSIDDIYEHRIGPPEIIGLLEEAHTKNPDIQNVVPFQVNLSVPSEVWRAQVQTEWPKLQPYQQEALLTELSRVVDIRWLRDRVTANRLEKAFPRKTRIMLLSPSEWMAQKNDLLQNVSSNDRILCLFDQDLSDSVGFSDVGPKSGIGLVQELLQEAQANFVICGILTHTIPTIDDEMPMWRSLAEEWSLELSSFLPLAKVRLADEDPLVFADGIKKTVLNIYCEQIKDEGAKIFQQASQNAIERIMEIDVYDFDHMIMLSSAEEGVREVDTLIRLFNLFHQDSLRKLVLDAEIASWFNTLIQTSRPISQIETKTNESIRPSEIRSQELYEAPEVVRYTPLQLGDIFECTTTSGKYILLAQPCDLMIRLDGKRSSENPMVALVPITDTLSIQEAKEKESEYWRTHSAISYFPGKLDKKLVLTFRDTLQIGSYILDLAVLDTDGYCKFDATTENRIPVQLTVGWQTYLENLISSFVQKAEELERKKQELQSIGDEQARNGLWESVLKSHYSLESPLTFFYDESTFDFDLRRIGRYREHGAERLLKSYADYLSRNAEPHDFANS